MIVHLRTIPTIGDVLQQEILECYDRESNDSNKLMWLMLFGQFDSVDASLLDWIDSRWSNTPDRPRLLGAHFRHAFVEAMGRLFHRCEVSAPETSQENISQRILSWLRLRSLDGQQPIRKQARRWILSHPRQADQLRFRQVIEEGFSDPAKENRRDAFWCLYRMGCSSVDGLGELLTTTEVDLNPGDRDMILDLSQRHA